jgi:UDP-N-acetylglucosamine:LPS N-acetylglucosamine transferase
VITGGGTGGHTSPGLAVATALQQRGLPHVWIGSRDGIEARRAAEQSITYYAIPTGKLRRYWAWRNISDLAINVPAGVLAAHRLVRRLRPRAVLATGGFVALPVGRERPRRGCPSSCTSRRRSRAGQPARRPPGAAGGGVVRRERPSLSARSCRRDRQPAAARPACRHARRCGGTLRSIPRCRWST